MSDLTTAMGIASPSIYACFGSKEQLFREAVELYGATEGAEPRRLLDETPTAREAIAAMLRANADSFVDPGTPPGCMVVLAATAGTSKNSEVRTFLAERRHGMYDLIHARLERALREGELPEGTDIGAIATFYITIQQGMSIQSRDGASRAELDRIIDQAIGAWDGLVKAG